MRTGNDMEALRAATRELRIPTICDDIPGVQAAAVEGNWSHTAFLRELLELEVERRIENRKNQRVKRAGFPQLKYLQ